MAAMAASFTASGPSKSGKPWPRLMALCSVARRDISAKMLVPKVETRWADFMVSNVRGQKQYRVGTAQPIAEWLGKNVCRAQRVDEIDPLRAAHVFSRNSLIFIGKPEQ